MNLTRLFDFFPYQAKKHPLEVALAAKVDGQWKAWSSEEVVAEIRKWAKAMYAWGLRPGDKVAIISNNRPEWNFADHASLLLGCVNVPIYPTITDEDYAHILTHADVKLILLSSKELYSRIQPIASNLEHNPSVFTLDKIPDVPHFSEWFVLENTLTDEQLDEISNKIVDTDLATVIYTSGTTGKPKGVMLSHRNIVFNVTGSSERVPCVAGNKALSFLPLCHIYERMIFHLLVERCISVYYAESMETIADNIREVKPHVFSSVPRLLEKVYDRIITKGKDLKGIKKALFFWAVDLGLRYELNGKNGWWYEFQLSIANKLIFSKWREALGGNLNAIVSGAAALQPRLARVFWAAKIHVLEGYGLTETSPVIAVNYLATGQVGFGTVGTPISNVEVKIAEDGEILSRSECNFLGYYRDPELTASVMDADGWFHTGDIGMFTSEGYLKITDRKKEIFKTSGGKYIAPQVMENKFKESLLIEQIMVIGEGEKFPAALISPSEDHLKTWCKLHQIHWTNLQEVCKIDTVVEKFRHEIDHYNEQFGQWEKLKEFRILPTAWSVEGGELTPTLKLKRKFILNKYRDYYDDIYQKN